MDSRLGILVSHPIQYFAPWFRHLAQRIDIEVFYAQRQDAKAQAASGFGVEFDWDVPLLEGYPYRWLTNVARKPSVGTFNGLDTPELYSILRKDRFDAVLLFGWNRKCAWQAIRACRKERIPVLMRGDSHLHTKRSLVKSAVKCLPYRSFLPRINAHLYVGKRNKQYLEHYGVPNNRLFFSPHFVDSEFFASGAREARHNGAATALRKRFGIPVEAFVFLFVGKLIPKKRPVDFVKACQRLMDSQEAGNIHGLIVGDGPLRGPLEATARSCGARIHFAGFQNQTQLCAFYQIANALVLPSDGGETWGLVVNEGFACGLPAVVSDAVGCAPDLIEEGCTGFTFSLADIEGLTKRLLMIKALSERDSDLVQAALARKREQYSMEAATDGLAAALVSVGGESKPRQLAEIAARKARV